MQVCEFPGITAQLSRIIIRLERYHSVAKIMGRWGGLSHTWHPQGRGTLPFLQNK